MFTLRHALRALIHRPGVPVAAVLILGLAVGASTAVYSIFELAVLRPLPFPDPERLVMPLEIVDADDNGNLGFETFVDWRDGTSSVEYAAVMTERSYALSGDGEPEQLPVLRVSTDYFRVLGIDPALGRNFTAEDDRSDARFVALLSHQLWQRRFGSDRDVVGSTIVLANSPFEVIGVMPPELERLVSETYTGSAAEIYAPLGYELGDPWACRSCGHLRAIARLGPDVTLERASTESAAVWSALRDAHPDDYSEASRMELRPLSRFLVTPDSRRALGLLLAAIAMLLVMAATNVGILFLVRTARRLDELSVRTALGAGRSGIFGLLMTEGVLVSLAAGLVGFLVAQTTTALLVQGAAEFVPMASMVEVGRDSLGVSLLAALVCSLLFASLPALYAARSSSTRSLAGRAHATSGRGYGRLQSTLVTTNVLLATVLLVGATLMVRSVVSLLATDPGFETEGRTSFSFYALGPAYEDGEPTRQLYGRALESIRAIPGVRSASMTSQIPLGGNYDTVGIEIESRGDLGEDNPSLERYAVGPTT